MSTKEIIKVKTLPNKIVSNSIYSIEQSNVNSYTHSFFKYPCKFIPEIPRWAIKKYIDNKSQIIFDPFAGSGTTILEACLNGNNAFYTEIDEVACLITNIQKKIYVKFEKTMKK